MNQKQLELAGKTAIHRKKLSAPMHWLITYGYIPYALEVLDYGCGYGEDADYGNFDKYDPVHHPKLDKRRRYDVITCIYVLNVIESRPERMRILFNIRKLLKHKGKAYIVVRRDVKYTGLRAGGTYQGHVWLDNLQSIYSCARFEIYEYTNLYGRRK